MAAEALDGVDGCLIYSEPSRHLELIQLAGRRGVPIFIEKPLVVDATEVQHAADALDTSSQVGYFLRYCPALRELRARLTAGDLGEVRAAAIRCRGCGRRIKPKKRGCDNPKCKKPGVGWAFVIDRGRRGDGKRRQVLRSGFETRGKAETALEKFIDESGVEPTNVTVEEYLLECWLPRTRTSVKTHNDRETHMRAYVVPRIGSFKLVNLTGEELNEMYDDLAVRGRTQRRDPELG